MKVNEVKRLSLFGEPHYEIVIRQVLRFKHPKDGRIVMKDFRRSNRLVRGVAPVDEAGRQALIEKRKREHEAYMLAAGVEEVWWELPPTE